MTSLLIIKTHMLVQECDDACMEEATEIAKAAAVWSGGVTFIARNPPIQQLPHCFAQGMEVAGVIEQVKHMNEAHIAQAQRSARHANRIHPGDEATGQVEARHTSNSDAMEVAVACHDVRPALVTMRDCFIREAEAARAALACAASLYGEGLSYP